MTEQERREYEVARMLAIMNAAVRDALIVHKKLGHAIVECRDGQVVRIPADEIIIPDELVIPPPLPE